MEELSKLGFRYRALFPIPLAILTIIFANPTINSLIYGSFLVLLGSIIRVICLGYLGVKSRDEIPNIANLITAGPYKYSRNPVYIANTIIATGFVITAFGGYGIILNTIVSLITVIIYVSFYNFFVIPSEEKFLEEKFGQEYLEYKQSVPRWLINLKSIEEKGRFRFLPVFRTEYWTWMIIIALYVIILIKGKIIKI